MEGIHPLLEFLQQVALTTLSQLVWLLGHLAVFGLLLYLLARFTRRAYVRTVGVKFHVYATGWFGTPIHELGHAVFCILFRHRIVAMRLWAPSSTDGTLGYVSHTYNPRSTYQRIGNFFIGVGPILFGTLVLYALLYYLVPNAPEVLAAIQEQGLNRARGILGDDAGVIPAIGATALATVGALFHPQNLADYRFWIFLYLAICVASHMELSPPDIRGAAAGLIAIVALLLAANLLVLGAKAAGLSAHFGPIWRHVRLEGHAGLVTHWVGTLGGLLLLASIISLLTFVASFIALTAYSLIARRGILNPFW